MTKSLSSLFCLLALLVPGVIVHAQQPAANPPPLVVVELFQSQGCSSCPPAEANLNAIAGQPGILALNWSLTYWDNFGWKDTFASAAYTDRQWAYARHHRRNQVWTPQVYIDGQTDLVGVDRTRLEQAVAQASMRGPSVSWGNDKLTVGAGKPGARCDVWLVRYDPRTLNVPIGAGENRGRTLPQRNVVRELVHLGNWNGNPRSYAVPPSQGGLATAVLVQVENGGPILGAASTSPAR
ncbi:MAG: DUF1223 domain-containing protein [Rhodanobacter sp.]